MLNKNSKTISSDWRIRVADEIEALNEIYLDTFKLVVPNKSIQIKIIPNSLKILIAFSKDSSSSVPNPSSINIVSS